MTAPKSKPNTLADFRAKHDRNVIVPDKIKKALETMTAEGPENWLYESDFIRLAGISQTDMGTFRDQFEDHIVLAASEVGSKRAPRKVWFASAKVAAKLRSE